MQRLTKAGFSKDFVRRAILPDWWDETDADSPGALQEIELRVARFLGAAPSSLQDHLTVPAYAAAHLRRVRDVSRERLGPSIHAAMRIAEAVSRNLKNSATGSAAAPLPADPLAWRAAVAQAGKAPTLVATARDLWRRGIPVVPVDILPGPSFQGMACVTADRPVILLGHKHDEPGRVAFVVAHEAGHIAAGDCQPNAPVIDEDDEIVDESEMEQRAEAYAMHLLAGASTAPAVDDSRIRDFKELANAAIRAEREHGAEASLVIYGWARRTLDYQTATLAVKALYRATGARRELRDLFVEFVDIDAASETDRDLLRCVHGVVLHEAAG